MILKQATAYSPLSIRSALLLLIGGLLYVYTAAAQPWLAALPEDSLGKISYAREVELFDKYWEGRAPERGKGYKPFMRKRWFWDRRIDEAGQFDIGKHWSGWEEKQRLFSPNATDDADWLPMGPMMIPTSGGGVGRVNCVTVHPTNPNIIWIGAASGGAWRTSDGGNTWETTTDYLPLLGVSSVVIDHVNPNVIYLASGDNDGGNTYSAGVLKSTDGGDTWNPTGLTYQTTNYRLIGKLTMSRTDHTLLIAATHSGMYRTTDAGETWQLTSASNTTCHDLEQDAGNPDIWYVGRSSGGVLKSIDNGVSWTTITNGLPPSGYGRVAIALTAANPLWVYALYSNSSSGFYGLYRSTDRGDSWTQQSNSPNLMGWAVDGNDTGGQAWYDLCIAASPIDPNVVIVGGVNLWKSTDGGVTWSISAHWYGANGNPYAHADQHDALFVNGTSTVYVGNDGGLFKSTDAGVSWVDKSGGGLAISQFYRISVSAQNPNTVIGGSQDNGTSFLRNNLWRRVIGGDGMDCLIDFSNPNYMYGNIQNGNMQRSYNGGSNWVDANNGVGEESRAWAAPMTINSQNPATVYRATTMIYKSTNHGESWSPISTAMSGSSPLTSLTVAPSDSNYIYTCNGSNFYRTTNGGTNWNRLSTTPGSVSRIAVDPVNPEHLWITIEGYSANSKVYSSTNAGSSWVNLSAGLPNVPVNCIIVHPNQPLQVYIGTDLGAYVSNTGGGNWVNFSQGLPNVIIDDLEIQIGSDVILAGTFGRGVWLSPLEPFNAAGEPRIELPHTVRMRAYPNPFNSTTDLRVTLPQRGELSLAIYDNTGRMVIELVNGKHEAGVYFYPFDATELSSGTYFARASIGNVTITEKLSLLK